MEKIFEGIKVGELILIKSIKETCAYKKDILELTTEKNKLPNICRVEKLNMSGNPVVNIIPYSSWTKTYYLGFFEFKRLTHEIKYLI